MKKIYIVNGCIHYEGCTVLRVFTNKKDAKTFVEECKNLQKQGIYMKENISLDYNDFKIIEENLY